MSNVIPSYKWTFGFSKVPLNFDLTYLPDIDLVYLKANVSGNSYTTETCLYLKADSRIG